MFLVEVNRLSTKDLTTRIVCLEVKMIGKPSGGKLHAGFDEGGLDDCLWATLNGHEAGNGGYSHLSAVPGTGGLA